MTISINSGKKRDEELTQIWSKLLDNIKHFEKLQNPADTQDSAPD